MKQKIVIPYDTEEDKPETQTCRLCRKAPFQSSGENTMEAHRRNRGTPYFYVGMHTLATSTHNRGKLKNMTWNKK
eukprot:scaffold204358_cov57-Attheya_sp.AAC.2